jgi:RNA polymerase sigma factor (sigma-70 family)
VARTTTDWDVQDARDRQLLAQGAIEELLARYVDLIQARCRTRCGSHGDDVAQEACVRLWRELQAGKHREGRRPFREIVNGVVAFACRGYEGATFPSGTPIERDPPEPPDDGFECAVESRIDIEDFIKSLSAGDADVARMRFAGAEIDQIAEALGRSRNAVDQSLYRIRREWKRWIEN